MACSTIFSNPGTNIFHSVVIPDTTIMGQADSRPRKIQSAPKGNDEGRQQAAKNPKKNMSKNNPKLKNVKPGVTKKRPVAPAFTTPVAPVCTAPAFTVAPITLG